MSDPIARSGNRGGAYFRLWRNRRDARSQYKLRYWREKAFEFEARRAAYEDAARIAREHAAYEAVGAILARLAELEANDE